MKPEWKNACKVVVLAFIAFRSLGLEAQVPADQELLGVRESVWRAWFAGDTEKLAALVPPETIVMSGGEREWKRQSDVLRSSAEFHSHGGKLIQLAFPRTEVQHFGNVAIIWSTYRLQIEVDGKQSLVSSRVTEIFVYEKGHWINPGWHTDEEK